MDIQVDIIEEPSRGCGKRRSGPSGVGLYLVGGGIPMPCDRLPFPLDSCPNCGHQYEHSRGFTWINPQKLFAPNKEPSLDCCGGKCGSCPMGNLTAVGDKAGLMWVGRKFYTPDSFRKEAFSHPNGVCKRINELPSDFVLGKHIVYLAHVDGAQIYLPDDEEYTACPGVFMAFKPQRLEGVIDNADKIPQRAIDLKQKFGDGFRIVKVEGSDSASGDDDDNERTPRNAQKAGSALLTTDQLSKLSDWP